jgi:transcription elongation factor Elf1
MSASTGTCPVCNGTKRIPALGDSRHVVYGYDNATETFPCDNCGGQKQFELPTGLVPLRPDGTPCKHEYKGTKLGNCYWMYTCKHCGESHNIDSGD